MSRREGEFAGKVSETPIPPAPLAVSPYTVEKLLIENRALYENLKATQVRCTELVNERRATLRAQVREFHAVMGQPILETPVVPDIERVRFRLALIAEEFCELFEAATVGIAGTSYAPRHLAGTIRAYLHDAVIGVKLPEFADALADLAYVVEGTNIEFGIDSGPVLAEVQRANLEKLGGGIHPETKKYQKPPGWAPPDIEAVLRAQGWKTNGV